MMGEIAAYFVNARRRRLFGVLHSPTEHAGRRVGVVFCHPIAEEKHASNGAIVGFARYLASLGIPSLRFDREGFGDSEGDLEEASVSSQVSDIEKAIDRLRDAVDIEKVVLVGVRFGATLARLVAESGRGVSGLVLVEPVVSGEDYWNGLLRSQQMSFMMRGIRTPTRDALLNDLAEHGRIEVKAEYFSKEFVDELSRIDLLETANSYPGAQMLAVERGSSDTKSLGLLADAYARSAGPPCDFIEVEKEFWTGKTLYESYLPADLYRRAAEWIARLEA